MAALPEVILLSLSVWSRTQSNLVLECGSGTGLDGNCCSNYTMQRAKEISQESDVRGLSETVSRCLSAVFALCLISEGRLCIPGA